MVQRPAAEMSARLRRLVLLALLGTAIVLSIALLVNALLPPVPFEIHRVGANLT